MSATTVCAASTASSIKILPASSFPLERTPEGEFLYLVEQFRYTIQRRAFEFPQGGWEREQVDPEELAHGELQEETGMVACNS